MGRVIAAFTQLFDGSGDPLARGWLRFLESGSNNTDKNTYYDPLYQIPNANPLQLDGEGRVPDVFGSGDYRVISYINDPDDEDSPGEQIQVFDPVTAEYQTGSGGGSGSFPEWDISETYESSNLVQYNGQYYRSLVNGNIGYNPAIEEYAWEQIDFLRFYNSNITYTEGDLVFYNYNLYLSKQSLNIGNDPESSPAYWRPVATGYHNVYIKTASYEILPSEFDSIFILGTATAGTATFDLPAMDATTDRFRVAVYNQSSYDLTVSGLGGVPVWIDASGDIVLEPGVFQEFIYSHDVTAWLLMNNSGRALGGQDLGTTTKRVENAYINTVNIVSATITNLYVTATHIPSDQYLYFGDSDNSRLTFESVGNTFSVNVLSLPGEIAFRFNAILMWTIYSDGQLYPGPSNTTPYLGTSTYRVERGYINNLYLIDNGVLNIGSGNDLRVYHNGTNSIITNSTGYLAITNTSANPIYLQTNSATAILIQSTLNSLFYGNIYIYDQTKRLYFGPGADLQIYHNTSNANFDCDVGNIYFRTGAGLANALLIDSSQNVNFYGNTSLGTDELHYLGDANNADIGFTVANGLMLSTNAATQITINTNNSNRWIFDSSGNFLPVTNETYDIGSATYRVNNIYAANIFNDKITSPGALDIWVNGGSETPVGYVNRITISNIWTVGTDPDDCFIGVTCDGQGYVFRSGFLTP